MIPHVTSRFNSHLECLVPGNSLISQLHTCIATSVKSGSPHWDGSYLRRSHYLPVVQRAGTSLGHPTTLICGVYTADHGDMLLQKHILRRQLGYHLHHAPHYSIHWRTLLLLLSPWWVCQTDSSFHYESQTLVTEWSHPMSLESLSQKTIMPTPPHYAGKHTLSSPKKFSLQSPSPQFPTHFFLHSLEEIEAIRATKPISGYFLDCLKQPILIQLRSSALVSKVKEKARTILSGEIKEYEHVGMGIVHWVKRKVSQ